MLAPSRLEALRQEIRRQDEEERAPAAGGGNLEGLDDAITDCEALLWRLREAVKDGDPLLLRQVVRESVVRIELARERRPHGKWTRYVIQGGVIHLRPQLGEECRALHGKPCNKTTSDPEPAST